MRTRLITGPILIAALLGVVWLDGFLATRPLPAGLAEALGRDTVPPGTALLVVGLVAVSLAALELRAVLVALGGRPSPGLLVLAAAAGVSLPWAGPLLPDVALLSAVAATIPVALVASGLLLAVRGRRLAGATHAAAGAAFVFVYPGLAIGMLLALRHAHDAWWIVGVVMTVKACDIGAYFTGHAIGRHKMIPWLSPGKTWEGLAGGIATSGLVGFGLAALSARLPETADHVAPVGGLVLGLLFGAAGQFGDLAMSLLKRDAGLKDSSSILPGMGGVMDVLDSPALVAPLAFWLVPLAAG